MATRKSSSATLTATMDPQGGLVLLVEARWASQRQSGTLKVPLWLYGKLFKDAKKAGKGPGYVLYRLQELAELGTYGVKWIKYPAYETSHVRRTRELNEELTLDAPVDMFALQLAALNNAA